MPPERETLDAFKQRMNCEWVVLTSGPRQGLIVFENSAWSNGFHHCDGTLGPHHSAENARKVRIDFYTQKRDNLNLAYQRNRQEINMQMQFASAGAGSLPPKEWRKTLQQQADQLKQLEQTIAELKAGSPASRCREELAAHFARTTESFVQFKQRMGCESIKIARGRMRGMIAFENGAHSDGETRHSEPHGCDAETLLRVRYAFYSQKLSNVTEQFNGLRRNINRQLQFYGMGAGPAPADGWEQQLEALSEQIEELQQQTNELQAQLPEWKQALRSFDRDRAHRQAVEVAFNRLLGF